MTIDLHNAPPVPALVLGRGYTALGALRALAQAGIDAYVACPEGDLATRSRWYRPLPGVAWNGSPSDEALGILESLPLARAVPIPCADDIALWLADVAAGPLASRFPTCIAPRATLEILQDKDRFARHLAGTGVPHPRTFVLADEADVRGIPFESLDRVFLKPANSQQFLRAQDRKGVWVSSRAELERQWRHLHAQGFELVAQEYVPGSAADHYFIDGFRDRHGILRGVFCRRRLRINPPDFGNSSYCRSIPTEDMHDALAGLESLLSGLAYRGIFSAEFKRDSRNGEFRLLEINTRAWWYVEFAARCGVNVCRMAWEDALDLPVAPPQRVLVGRGCVNLLGDLESVRAQRLPPRAWPSIAAQWLRARFHVFRIDDPVPGLVLFASQARRWLRRLVRRLRPQRVALDET